MYGTVLCYRPVLDLQKYICTLGVCARIDVARRGMLGKRTSRAGVGFGVASDGVVSESFMYYYNASRKP